MNLRLWVKRGANRSTVVDKCYYDWLLVPACVQPGIPKKISVANGLEPEMDDTDNTGGAAVQQPWICGLSMYMYKGIAATNMYHELAL